MANEKKPLWKDWRLWVGVIIVIAIVGAVAGGGQKKEDNTNTTENTQASQTEEDKLSTMGEATVRLGKCAVLKVADKVAEGEELTDISYSVTGHIDECQRAQSQSVNAGNVADYNSQIDSEWESRKDEQLGGQTLMYWLKDWANK